MTREEEIKVLAMFLHKQCDLGRTEFAYDANTVWEAVNMASKALKQQPCEDAVSRKAVEEMLNARGQKAVMTFDHFIELLYKLPSVTPVRKHGKWEEEEFDLGENLPVWVGYKCSKCGKYSDSKSDFCPYCGAEMENNNETSN